MHLEGVDPTAAVWALNAFLIAFTALIGTTTALLYAVFRLRNQINQFRHQARERDDATDRDVESVVLSQMRRGRQESEENQLRKEVPMSAMAGPEAPPSVVIVRQDVREAYKPIMDWLQKIKDANPGVNRARFALLLEQAHGPWLVQHICKLYGLRDNACWDLAADLVGIPDDVAKAS